ncbi:DUF4270 domain-containing protein [Flavobacterium hauense]
MTNSSFLKRTIFALFALSAVLLVSCDDDFNFIGADVIGGDTHSNMTKDTVDVVAYDRPMGAVQSNNMLQNQLGIYDNPVFGKTVSHFVTQIAMASENPTIYDPVVDSVYLYVPYRVNIESVADDGETLYKWDKDYFIGDETATFDLKLYRNGYYLRDSDPGATDNIQRYFSDDKQMVDNMVVEQLYDAPSFSFSRKELEIHAKQSDNSDKLVETKKPGMLFYLDANRMKEIFFSEANKGNLLNNTIFKDYFRGLYFKVQQTGGAVMNTPDFTSGTITCKIHDYESRTDGVAGPNLDKPRISKTVTFNLKGNTINFFDNSYNSTFNTAVTTSDAVNGDDQLFVKGGAGSMSVIELNQDQLNALMPDAIGEKILINEANLIFHIDKGAMANAPEPARIYLYDLTNKKPIADYSMDGTTSLGNPKGDKKIYGGIRDTINNQYKITVTNHIKNIIKGNNKPGDSLNVKLGLVITDNINITTNYKLKTPFTEGDTQVKDVPYASVQSLLGTVLYGTGANVPDGKKIKLEIYYSKPKE